MTTGLTCEETRDLAPAYVLGALESDEASAVRDHLTDCPELHEEFAELGSVASTLAELPDRHEPAPELKGRILAAAAADLEARQVPAPSASVPPAPPIPFLQAGTRVDADAPRRSAPRSGGRFEWVLRIAAVLAIVSLLGWNLLLQGRLDESETYARDVAAVLEAAAQPGAVTAVLAPNEGAEGRGLAAIDAQGSVLIAMRDLAPTAGDQVYEAWLIVADGAPVPVGGFRVGPGGTGRLDGSGPPAVDGAIVALTLEPGPGATTPTLPIVSFGTATASGES